MGMDMRMNTDSPPLPPAQHQQEQQQGQQEQQEQQEQQWVLVLVLLHLFTCHAYAQSRMLLCTSFYLPKASPLLAGTTAPARLYPAPYLSLYFHFVHSADDV